jgi:hypothetical protein
MRRDALRTRRAQYKTAISFLFFLLPALLAGWFGCAAGNSTHTTAAGTGGSTASGLGGAGGAGRDGGTGGAEAGQTCDPPNIVCDGGCVMPDDPKYGCTGNCGNPCPGFPNATTVCMAGQCVLGPCDMGFKNCDNNPTNGCETDTQKDPNNCGSCGTVCIFVHATPACVNGMCKVGTCDMGGWTDCSGDGGAPDGGADIGCNTNTQMDPKNCGGCGNACPGQETCVMGDGGAPTCGLVCPKGFCHLPTDPPGQCATMLGTNKNCTFCGDVCNLPNSTSQCQMMMGMPVCDLVGCDAGWANCDMIAMNGCETNTTTSPMNCGNCGNQCQYGPHSTPICTNGNCAIVCDTGYADCNHMAQDGCEIHTDGDPMNCGMCGHACSTNHATETCTAGLCSIVTCQSGWSDCNKDPSDGCEANTQTDPLNCGTCGTICTTQNGTPACSQGMCVVGSCNPGFAHCAATGHDCETFTGSDVNNCGACGNKCSTNNDTPVCTGGMCVLLCTPLFGDCDGNVANGCETSTTTVQHCGTCATVCTTQNGTPACIVNGTTATCGVAGCSAGYAHCTATGHDCETFVGGTDVNNCGSCGHVCPGDATNPSLHDTAHCTGGVCGFTCDPGYGDCNTNPVDGCEANLSSDPNNCSTCGNNCVAACGGATGHVTTAACTGSACHITMCAAGYEDTDMTCADGCECKDSTTTSTCPVGATVLTLNVPFSSNLFPASPTAAAFFVVTFSGNGNLAFHPKITLTGPAGEFVMDITSDCANTLVACPDHGAGSVTTWETSYTGPVPAADPTQPTEFQPIPLPGNNGTVYIKVYRVGAMTSCNDQYTLTATD